MRGSSLVVGIACALGLIAACGGSSNNNVFPNSSGDDGKDGNDASVVFGSPDGSSNTSGDGGGATVCPTGLTCNVACPNNGTTSVKGVVYDPAGKNPLYNVAVYVPAAPLTALPKGVPTGDDACSCAALFKSGAVVSTTTKIDGTFELDNVPVGTPVPIVIQIGKWRRVFHVNVTACGDNQQPNPFTFPATVPAGDTDDSIPDIAISTGKADSLECLMRRIGINASEYVAGSSTSGHVHLFAGGHNGSGGGGNGGSGVGQPENPGFSGAPASSTSLWSSQAQLMPYDIVLLSCEGGETYNANPPALESYLNAGGRAFASHFHYSWFSGPLASNQSYSAPSDWGSHLANWSEDGMNQDNGVIGGTIDTTLNGGGGTFTKGQALSQWLGNVDALGQHGVPAADLSIYQPRYNAQVTSSTTESQPWITSGSNTMYFSFDTPVNAPVPDDGGAPAYCGRAVFSDLHVAGDPSTNDSMSPPNGCDDGDLSPQEKALEFMIFDLSSCVISDSVAPPTTVPTIPK